MSSVDSNPSNHLFNVRSSVYTVKNGDTPFLIAHRNNINLVALLHDNPQITEPGNNGGLKRKPDGSLIYPGEKLKITKLFLNEKQLQKVLSKELLQGPPAPPSISTLQEFTQSILDHIGPNDENYLTPNPRPFAKGALRGIITRLEEYLAGNDQKRLSDLDKQGFNARWAKSSCSKKKKDAATGFAVAYVYCAQTYIEGLKIRTGYDEKETREQVQILLAKIKKEVKKTKTPLISIP